MFCRFINSPLAVFLLFSSYRFRHLEKQLFQSLEILFKMLEKVVYYLLFFLILFGWLTGYLNSVIIILDTRATNSKLFCRLTISRDKNQIIGKAVLSFYHINSSYVIFIFGR